MQIRAAAIISIALIRRHKNFRKAMGYSFFLYKTNITHPSRKVKSLDIFSYREIWAGNFCPHPHPWVVLAFRDEECYIYMQKSFLLFLNDF